MSDEEFKKYEAQIHKKGRPRKYFTFHNVMLYKILDECKVRESNKKYIFKVPSVVDLGFKLLLNEYKSDKVELVFKKNSTTFKDILVSENYYELLNGTSRIN